jgi:hypothetical protein
MKTIRPLNINALYRDGVDTVFISRDWYCLLREIITQTTWVDDPDEIFIKVPSWSIKAAKQRDKLLHNAQLSKVEQEAEHAAHVLAHAPSDLLDACRGMLADPAIMGDWLRAYSAEIKFMSLWNGAEDLGWHWDGPARAGFFFLVYLNSKTGWKIDGGGDLQIGIRDIGPNFLKVSPADVSLFATIKPEARVLVCCDNNNPRFVHKVNPLDSEDERVVLMIGFDLNPTMLGDSYAPTGDF